MGCQQAGFIMSLPLAAVLLASMLLLPLWIDPLRHLAAR
jgi:hypothetical protein